MSRADAIMGAVQDEIDRRRTEIEADDSLTCISLIVKIDSRTDRPYLVIYRTEAQRRLTTTRMGV